MFSNSTKYAIRTVLFLAKNGDKKYTVPELGTELDIPKPFLSKILQQLSKNGIISSTKGRGGGFFLDKSNLKKKMIDIIITIEGHNIFDKCVLGLPECSNKNPCWLHDDYSDFKNKMEKSVFRYSIGKIIETEI